MKSIPVFYNPKMAAEAHSFSPSAGKASMFVRSLMPSDQITLIDGGKARDDQLILAHDSRYVDAIMSLRQPNGFGNTDAAVASSLPYHVGSLLSACHYICGAKPGVDMVACSPSSGFHHAAYDRAEGFCTFNGLMIAAIALLRAGYAKRIGIVDCDYHYGDGTEDIISTLGLRDRVRHYTAGAESTRPDDAGKFLRHLSGKVKMMADCDLVLYQAGADQHIDDPLGGLLTDEQMVMRDRTVFWTALTYRIPLVWNLAGGYRRDANGTIKPVLDTHLATMKACADIYIRGEEMRP